MNAGRAVLVLPIGAPHPDWFDEAVAAGVDVLALGPRRWLLCSDTQTDTELTAAWQTRMANVACVFEDAGDRFICLPVQASATRALSQQLLQPIDGLPVGSVVTTLLGAVPVVCRVGSSHVDVLVDRSLAHYARAWLQRTLADT